MVGEWPTARVRDLADSISDTHKRGKSHLVFLNTSDVLLGKLLNHSYSAVCDWPGQAKKSIKKGDILFSEIRPANGRWAYVDIDADDYVVSTKLMVIRSRTNHINPRFLYHFLTSSKTTSWLQHLAESRSGTFPQITFDQIAELELALPSLSVQAKIAYFLDAIDNKIELNWQMCETLEAISRSLFKSWFVDFDPVRAKTKDGQSSLPKSIADLFPDSFETSELGDVPKGWGYRSVNDIADVIYGAPFASSRFNAERNGKPLIRIRDLANECPGVWTPEVHPKGYMVQSGDIVVGMDGEFRAYLWGGEEAWLNQRVCVFVPKGKCSAAFVRNSIMGPLAHIEATETATTVIHLGKSDIDRFLVVIPTEAVIAAFTHFCQPLYDRIIACKHESRILIELRDTLLPKLMSGELRVKDAERFIGGKV